MPEQRLSLPTLSFLPDSCIFGKSEELQSEISQNFLFFERDRGYSGFGRWPGGKLWRLTEGFWRLIRFLKLIQITGQHRLGKAWRRAELIADQALFHIYDI